MKLSGITPGRKTGRPLSFDRQAALEEAMLVFWRSGYETTSIVDLTTAMGISAPSLYTAFGDKKRLFLEAIQLYAGDLDDIAHAITNAPSAYDFACAMLTAAADKFTGETTPPGCLLASATASCSAASADVQQAVSGRRREIEGLLRHKIQQDIAGGILPSGTSAAPLSGLVMAVAQGMSVLARDGATRIDLHAIVHAAMLAWPRRPGEID